MSNGERNSFWGRMSEAMDGPVSVLSPRLARARQAHRFAYEVLDRSRLRKKRIYGPRAGDRDLSESTLDELRQIARDLSNNNPLVKGLFRKLVTNIVGTSTRIQARTEDKGWNEAAEQAVKAEMVEQPCDVTGRFNFHAYIHKCDYRFMQDGDIFTLLTDEGPQAFQGECCGTPYGSKIEIDPQYYDVVNGVAFSKQTGRVLGYYLGKPNKWGYIQPTGYQKYPAEIVHHMFDPERFDHSRGEPMLTSAVVYIDLLFGYVDAEVVAAKVNACFPLKVKTYTGAGLTGSLGGMKTTGGDEKEDDYGRRMVRMEPGQIWEGDSAGGEELDVLGAARPAQAFDPFVMRMLMFIGSPLCLPLMLTTGDFSNATFMNGRFAYNEARAFWRDQQELVVRPLVRRLWLWKIRQLIDRKVLTQRDDWTAHQIYLKRWPYVDPYREAQADKIELLDNLTTTRTDIAARQGRDWSEEILAQRVKEENEIAESGVVLTPQKQAPQSNGEEK